MVTIYDYSGNALISFEAYPSGSRYSCKLMEQDYITLEFFLIEPIFFPIGSYVDTDFGKFVITFQQNPTYQPANGSYKYSLRFDKYYYVWKNHIFKFVPEDTSAEAAWALTAELSVHLDVFLRNLTANGWSYGGAAYRYEIDSSITGAKYLRYNATNLIDALTEMANAWECEWWVTSNVIHFGTCLNPPETPATGYTFQLIGVNGNVLATGTLAGSVDGDTLIVDETTILDGNTADIVGGVKSDLRIDVNVETISSSRSSGNYYNRLYCFGSTKNIPSDYRTGGSSSGTIAGIAEKRLMLPASYNQGKNYIDAETGLNPAQIVEGVYTNENIYPKRVGTIGSVTSYTDTTTDETTGQQITETFYRFTDADANFHFSKDYILEGRTLEVTFETGALAGMTFELAFNPDGLPEKDGNDNWNAAAQIYEIIKNESYGMGLPDGTLIPATGDKFVITGFNISLVGNSYIAAAEAELLAAAQDYIEQCKIDNNNYTCTLISDFSHGNDLNGGVHTQVFNLGDSVTIKNAAFFKDGERTSRVMGWELDLEQPYRNAQIIVGNKANYSRYGALEATIKEVEAKSGKDGKAGAKGETGERGAMPRARGLYSASETYYYNENYRDIVYDSAGNVWMVKNSGDTLTGVTPSTSSEFWLPADKSIFTAIDTALIENANIAGFMYKGGLMVSQALDENDQPMLSLDGVTGVIRAKQGEFAGTINSSSGTIGGFVLGAASQTATSGFKTMVLAPNNIVFTNTQFGVTSKFGSGAIEDGIFTNLSTTNPISVKVLGTTDDINGIYLDITGGSPVDSVAGSGNSAIKIKAGKISGFRTNVRRVSSSQNLTAMDSVIINRASSNITLTLPSTAEDGQMYWIKNNGSGSVTLSVAAGSVQTINDGKTSAKTSWTHSTGEMIFVVYDSVDSVWQAGYMSSN